MNSDIQFVFVLMLENRSFDHMLGFSGITGTDAASGQPTQINGLTGTESNMYNGQSYQVSHPADWTMQADPGHGFLDTLEELCGQGSVYPRGGPYPPIHCSGFVTDYVKQGGKNPGDIMKCFEPGQLPVLNALAREFVVCDNWFSSLPGPTWPNRFFIHAASSAGLEHAPSFDEIALWTVEGLSFQNGSIFDRLNQASIDWHVYKGDITPQALAVKGVHFWSTSFYIDFQGDVASGSYQHAYTFIEPNYGDLLGNTYVGGNSQHPLDNAICGEWLIKHVYETIRNSPLWNNSLLIITWDEHGGFYDHVPPPQAVSPGDNSVTSSLNQSGFTFTQYGVRVPAVVVSPLIPQNLIDHRTYDHASVPATLEAIFGVGSLTDRDANANSVSALVSLSNPRPTPSSLPAPVSAGAACPFPGPGAPVAQFAPRAASLPRPSGSLNEGNLPGFLHVALMQDVALSPPEQRQAIIERFQNLKSQADAAQYLEEVREKIRAAPPVPPAH